MLGLIASTSLAAPAAMAQTASQITPQRVRPSEPVAAAGIAVPELSGPASPKGAGKLSVRLAHVEIEGAKGSGSGSQALAAADAGLSAALADRTVTVADIFSAARVLEAAYGRAGLVLTRVVVPAQNLKNGGTLKVVVISGFVERIDTQSLPGPVKDRVGAVLAPLVGRPDTTLADIERALMLASDTPGLSMKSTLTAGKKPGGSVLIIDGRYKPVSGSVSADNTVGSGLGGLSTTAALQVNSVLGLGELFYIQLGGYPNFVGTNGFFSSRPVNRQIAGGVVLPLGTDGWSLNLEAIRTDSTPAAVAGQQFASRFDRVSARLKYAIVRSRGFNLSNEVAFDAEEEALSTVLPLTNPVSLDRLRVLRDTVAVSGVTPWGAFMSGQVTGSLGINGLGARSAAAATALLPLSRQGADANFQKLEFSGRYSQRLMEHLGLDLFVRGQTSFGRPLPRAEQIGLVGGNALSAFDAGAFQGDSGLVARAELSSPFAFDLTSGAANASPYAFGAVGSIWLMNPTAVERRQTTAGTFGLGLRVGAAPNPPGTTATSEFSGIIDQAILSLEWGRQYRNDGTAPKDRFTISSSIQF
ncbi:ShlB/FhaC/HecB family hemolysin secretion/activation protein [Rhizobium aquaticum]|uniref:ShlB/FhaC/HecB family hemolysin secretion/activation protein n=1 Tax=Rhizobium aquaticum TaxID=1549636 RepID=UPI00339A3A89